MITPEMGKITKSLRIVKALVAGVDPNSGGEIKQDSVFHDPEVIRALVVCAATLEEAKARALRRSALPKKVGQSCTEDEEEQLKKEFAEALDVEQIAVAHGRTVRAIETRAEMRGLMKSRDMISGTGFDLSAKKGRRRK
jgi:hypothetical protein